MQITTSSNIAAPVQETFLHRMLSTPVPYLTHETCAMKYTMPAQGGTIAKMRRAERLPTATVPLGNTGMTPPAAVPEVTDISAQMQFYGNYILIQEQVVLQSQDPKNIRFAIA